MTEDREKLDCIIGKYSRGEPLSDEERLLVDESIRALPPIPMAEIWEDIQRGIEEDAYLETGRWPVRNRVGQYISGIGFYLVVAAVLLTLLKGILWLSFRSENRPGNNRHLQVVTLSPKKPVKPPAQQVVLTLADNREIHLDTLSIGAVIPLGDHLSARKTGVDQLVYEMDSASDPDSNAWNRLSVGGLRKAFSFTLPDGSRIQLKPGSMFRYPLVRSGRDLAELEGEAYFDITPNSQQELAVLSPGGMTTQVLGTCFAIRARPGEEESKVSLISGTLKISFNGESRVLKNGGGLVLRNGKLQDVGLESGTGLFGWSGMRTDIRFDRTELSAALWRIANLYGLKVYNPDKVKGIPVTGVFYRDQSSDKILRELEDLESGAAFFSRNGGRIIVTEAPETQ
jgi:transmembrane sensor